MFFKQVESQSHHGGNVVLRTHPQLVKAKLENLHPKAVDKALKLACRPDAGYLSSWSGKIGSP
jgi:hypothetical protein